ncbi:unnamed protein product [Cladocopium goreaui]|uniref:GDP-mannose transporter GONST3 n=1 Tax=Cladocopium goreaui TaxID=2562237 RepID=A0A9P1BTY0_9DINO|nr:unnamed protein product [Cladocopium goreaui]|mmetsp:Transcript_76305/g.168533  ORF Transcript_76305/g.168533 Transcript_76305/m.168533 type:complete len:190 (+) Transcript_76305:56-625(+)
MRFAALRRCCALYSLLFSCEAAQPIHSRREAVVTSEGQAIATSLLRSEADRQRLQRLQPKPRLAACAGARLECTPQLSASNVDPCSGTDCKAHHACMGMGFQNCMIKVMGPGAVCESDPKGCMPACEGQRSSNATCHTLPRGMCKGSYVVIENVATQCFATLGANDSEVECENGSPCGDPERDNPYTGA